MPAARARDLLHAFLDVAAGEHRFISASLTVLPESGDLARSFVTWLEVAPVRGGPTIWVCTRGASSGSRSVD
jgi:hypothetical protein